MIRKNHIEWCKKWYVTNGRDIFAEMLAGRLRVREHDRLYLERPGFKPYPNGLIFPVQEV
jgi:hypothetical protein